MQKEKLGWQTSSSKNLVTLQGEGTVNYYHTTSLERERPIAHPTVPSHQLLTQYHTFHLRARFEYTKPAHSTACTGLTKEPPKANDYCHPARAQTHESPPGYLQKQATPKAPPALTVP